MTLHKFYKGWGFENSHLNHNLNKMGKKIFFHKCRLKKVYTTHDILQNVEFYIYSFANLWFKLLWTGNESIFVLHGDLLNFFQKNLGFFCRETQESNLLLKEQAENVKQKLERSELRCERLSQLEAENEVMHYLVTGTAKLNSMFYS